MKKKLLLEYPINGTIASLYTKLSTEGGLRGWFADRVEKDGDQFVFFWGKVSQDATLLDSKENKFVRFQWNEETDTDYYFEFGIESYELTGGVSLLITDFTDDGEQGEVTDIWDHHVRHLKRELGIQ